MMPSIFEKRRALYAVCMLVLLSAVSTTTACFFSSPTEPRGDQAQDAVGSSNVARATTSLTRTATGPARGVDGELARRIGRVIDESEFAAARWGIAVLSARDGRTLYARNAEQLFTPASNMKVYTTAVGLELLGADYRWRTSVYTDAQPDASGTISGDLVLYGRGAPDLTSRSNERHDKQRAGQREMKATPPDLQQLVDQLYERGVRRVHGRIIGDSSYFRGAALGDGWLWEDVQWYFGAEPSALSIDGNEFTLSVTPARKVGDAVDVKLSPATDYIRIFNDMTTAERGVRPSIGIERDLSSNGVRVWGEFPAGSAGYGVRLAVHRPALWAAQLFRDALRARGIAVDGDTVERDWRVRESEKFDPARAVELAAVLSSSLGEVVHDINKESLNLQAELVLRTLGKERGVLAPLDDPQKMRNRFDDQAAVAVVRLWLERAGIPADGMALHDGSGLSRLNLVTPTATARLMLRMAQSPASANIFRDSLPVAGRDGTLQYRLRDLAKNVDANSERIAAKTGALTYVAALSGYATTAEGEVLAFSIICNDETDRKPSTRVIDTIAALLAAYPNFDAIEE